MRRVALPAVLRDLDLPLIVSVSGGKDSTATLIALREAGLPFQMVFADTGWEAPETYAYLDVLRGIFGSIDVTRAERQMVEEARKHTSFPSRFERWCTRELKLRPMRAYHDRINGGETISVVGVRAAESHARANLPEVSDDDTWGGWVWRPLIDWSERDVYEAHQEAGVPTNPLYLRGHDRVGCYPCIFAKKDEIRLIAEHAPQRIEQIAALEAELTAVRKQENKPPTTFFRGKSGVAGGTYVPVERVVAWSRSLRGGYDATDATRELLAEPPSGGCFRLGFCEAPSQKK